MCWIRGQAGGVEREKDGKSYMAEEVNRSFSCLAISSLIECLDLIIEC